MTSRSLEPEIRDHSFYVPLYMRALEDGPGLRPMSAQCLYIKMESTARNTLLAGF